MLSQIRLHTLAIGGAVVLLTATVGGLTAFGQTTASTPQPGSQGTNVTLPATESAVTVTGAQALGASSPFANLSITVNQTQRLTNQAVSVSWTGGTPTDSDLGLTGGPFDDWYLQIFECWSNPGTSAADLAPVGCEFGANQTNANYTAPGNTDARTLEPGESSKYGYVDPSGQGTFIPFQPADGTAAIDVPYTTDASTGAQVTWDNPYFDYTTTNEIDYARTYSSGDGSALFTIDTGLEAPGLGCGQAVEQPNKTDVSPQCWLVVVPRGAPANENPSGVQCGGTSACDMTSPLGDSWANHIAIPLGFDAVGASCPIGANEIRIVGSEMAQPAIDNWEPSLCSKPNSPPYQYSALSDDQARQELDAGTSLGGPGMAVTSQALDQPSEPVTYAPLTLGGAVIGFNIERYREGTGPDGTLDDSILGTNVQTVYLTPRLVAKLLTESYQNAFYEVGSALQTPQYAWLKSNPENICDDPDFLQYNPEFSLFNCGGDYSDSSGLVVELPDSDAAAEVWQWILADPEAAAWLHGQPDPWGMVVNPYYSTNAQDNPSGAAFDPTNLESFPKSDPYTYQDEDQLVAANNQLPRPVGMQDFLPYATSMQNAALSTRTANDGDKLDLNLGATSPDLAWGSPGPQTIGSAFVMSITDSADAAQYGLQEASLSPAGEDSSTRTFVAPSTASFEAGESAMTTPSGSTLLSTDVSSADGYPLTMLTYAGVMPTNLTKAECADYAEFLDYAAGSGQVQGDAPGDLPLGYAPLPSALVGQTETAAKQIVADCGPAPSQPTDTSRTTPTTPTTPVASQPSSPSVDTQTQSTNPVTAPTTRTAIPSTPATTAPANRFTAATRTAAVALPADRLALPFLMILGFVAIGAVAGRSVWRNKFKGSESPR